MSVLENAAGFPLMQGKQKVDLFHHMNAQNKAGPGWNEAP